MRVLAPWRVDVTKVVQDSEASIARSERMSVRTRTIAVHSSDGREDYQNAFNIGCVGDWCSRKDRVLRCFAVKCFDTRACGHSPVRVW